MFNYNKIQFHLRIEFEDLRKLRVLALARRSTISQLIRESIKNLLLKEEENLKKIQTDIKLLQNKALHKASASNLREKGLIP